METAETTYLSSRFDPITIFQATYKQRRQFAKSPVNKRKLDRGWKPIPRTVYLSWTTQEPGPVYLSRFNWDFVAEIVGQIAGGREFRRASLSPQSEVRTRRSIRRCKQLANPVKR